MIHVCIGIYPYDYTLRTLIDWFMVFKAVPAILQLLTDETPSPDDLKFERLILFRKEIKRPTKEVGLSLFLYHICILIILVHMFIIYQAIKDANNHELYVHHNIGYELYGLIKVCPDYSQWRSNKYFRD